MAHHVIEQTPAELKAYRELMGLPAEEPAEDKKAKAPAENKKREPAEDK